MQFKVGKRKSNRRKRLRSNSMLRAPLPRFEPYLRRRASFQTQTGTPNPVGIFWDLRSKPPSHLRPVDAALRLNLLASRLGPVRLSFAYTLPFHRLPSPLFHRCHICGRGFPDHALLLQHFDHLHLRVHGRRLRRIDSATGSHRVRLAASMARKLDKYRNAARCLTSPSPLAIDDELTKAGMSVRTVPDSPEAVRMAVGEHVLEAVGKGVVRYAVLVSEDAGLEGAVREARVRGGRTVVVGKDCALRKCADAGFSWGEAERGKAREAMVTAAQMWRDGELLRRLEWAYQLEEEGRGQSGVEDDENDGTATGLSSSLDGAGNPGAWLELDSDSDSGSDAAV